MSSRANPTLRGLAPGVAPDVDPPAACAVHLPSRRGNSVRRDGQNFPGGKGMLQPLTTVVHRIFRDRFIR